MKLSQNFDHQASEERLYRLWSENDLFKTGRSAKGDSDSQGEARPAKPYAIMMPPPNVTGSLHIGHALNYSLQDVLIRIHRMKGFNVLWQAGTDHAGIATQMIVERQLAQDGITRHDLGRDAFLQKVWEWKELSGGKIVEQQRRLGLTPDWSRSRFTMDDGLSNAVKKVFVSLYNEGLIYKDKRLINWDTQLQTAVSDLEVKSVEEQGFYWHIKYAIKGLKDQYITVATSRPETLFGDTAIAVNPDDERYKHLIGAVAIVPICLREIPIVADSYSDPEKGTGAVKITPGHDFNDFEVAKRHNLPFISIFDNMCKMNSDVPEPYSGMDRFDGRKAVLQQLEKDGFLVQEEQKSIVLPRSERTDVILEPLLMDQWFVDAAVLAKPALKAVADGHTRIVPASWKNTYDRWLENIQPWCISRQLWWGHQIPAYYGPDEKIFVAESYEEALLQAHEHYGGDVDLRPETDVLDTWFSSALWPFSTLGWPEQSEELEEYYPTQVLITGTDILFFWVARMMMMSIKFMGKVPFKDVFLHALVRDSKGLKMSKTKGNVLDPIELIDAYGADALRFSLISLTVPGRDIKFSKDHVENSRHFVTKIWNSAKFAQHYGCVYNPDYKPDSCQLALNRWILTRLSSMIAEFEKSLGEYRFDDLAKSLYQFAWGDFCDWYLELCKPFLLQECEYTQETRETVAFVLMKLCKLMNPFMPFVTSELWGVFVDDGSHLMEQAWPNINFMCELCEKEIGFLIEVVEKVRRMRAMLNIASSQMIDIFLENPDELAISVVSKYKEVVTKMLRINQLVISDTGNAKGVKELSSRAVIRMPLDGLVDVKSELERLQKQLDACEKEMLQGETKLNNRDFISKAPQEVVDKITERYKLAKQDKEKINCIINLLKEE